MIAILATTAIGAILGLRFKVFVLVPAIAICSIGNLAMGVGRGNSIWFSLLGTLFVITALQIGYIAGTLVRLGAARARARKHQPGIVAVAQRR